MLLLQLFYVNVWLEVMVMMGLLGLLVWVVISSLWFLVCNVIFLGLLMVLKFSCVVLFGRLLLVIEFVDVMSMERLLVELKLMVELMVCLVRLIVWCLVGRYLVLMILKECCWVDVDCCQLMQLLLEIILLLMVMQVLVVEWLLGKYCLFDCMYIYLGVFRLMVFESRVVVLGCMCWLVVSCRQWEFGVVVEVCFSVNVMVKFINSVMCFI